VEEAVEAEVRMQAEMTKKVHQKLAREAVVEVVVLMVPPHQDLTLMMTLLHCRKI
jgi:hypothetical protein